MQIIHSGSTTGAPPGASGCSSLTTGRRPSSTATPSPAWPSSTTTTETVSDRIFTFLDLRDHTIIMWGLLGGGRWGEEVTRQNQTDGTNLFVKNQSRPVQLHSAHPLVTNVTPPSHLLSLFQESSGTMWPAPTRSPSSARMWTDTWPTPGNNSLRSEFLEKFVMMKNSTKLPTQRIID